MGDIFSKKSNTLIKRLSETLLRQIGDHRKCPHCNKGFVPNDVTSEMARIVYKEMFDENKKGT